jgi:uncharacterized peroxidase-related enzyme
LLGDEQLVRAVLEDPRSALIPEAEKALFAFLDKLNHHPAEVGREDIDAVKAAGWTDEAIYDATTVCALFNFYNRWIDGTGVQGLPAALYRFSGQRLAASGYVPPKRDPDPGT